MLVGDLADQLLDDVLEGHDAGRAAVLVDDDGQLQALLAQLGQQRVEPDALGHDQRLDHQRAAGTSAAALVAAPTTAFLTWTTPMTSSRSSSTTGKRECPVSRHSSIDLGRALLALRPACSAPAGSSRRPRCARRSPATG